MGYDLYLPFFPSTDVPRKNITLASFRRRANFLTLEPSVAKAPLQGETPDAGRTIRNSRNDRVRSSRAGGPGPRSTHWPFGGHQTFPQGIGARRSQKALYSRGAGGGAAVASFHHHPARHGH